MTLRLTIFVLIMTGLFTQLAEAESVTPGHPVPLPSAAADHVIVFVLEGVDRQSLKTGPMPALSRLAKAGAATWSAGTVTSSSRLPAMASLLTGLPVEKHGITWDTFEFSRGYPRPPTVFDYLDLSGGRDSAIFFMDESLYQLAKPEPYTDYQVCGPLKPECSPDRLVSYIRQYIRKAASGQGYGHAILALPHLLVVHLPEGSRAGIEHGWSSGRYRTALRSVDQAMESVLAIFKDHGLLARTTVFVTSLNGTGAAQGESATASSPVPWIASGAGIKNGHAIRQPVSIVDTGATVLRAFRLETHTEWDSHAVEEIFRDAPGVATTSAKGR
ncbi:MAG TPA: alkaline phosphatase [Nitrospira sp.]|nr:alkaline phosphatase [Nitrospira sp.]